MALWRRVACWISKATRPQLHASARVPPPHTHTEKHVILIAFHCNSGLVNAPACCVIRTLPVLYWFCTATGIMKCLFSILLKFWTFFGVLTAANVQFFQPCHGVRIKTYGQLCSCNCPIAKLLCLHKSCDVDVIFFVTGLYNLANGFAWELPRRWSQIGTLLQAVLAV